MPKPLQPQYQWKIKADFNKKKYLANELSIQDTLRASSDQPSTSYNSTIPTKVELLQKLLHHLMPSKMVSHHFIELKRFKI